MPASIEVNYLGDPEIAAAVRSSLESFMQNYEGQWTIRLLGSQQNTIWEMTVESPDGKTNRLTKLYGEGGGHANRQILIELQKTIEDLGGALRKRLQHIREMLRSMGSGTAKGVHDALQPTPYSEREVQLELDGLIESEPNEYEKVGDFYRWKKSYRVAVGKP
jgi:hypothetical protein